MRRTPSTRLAAAAAATALAAMLTACGGDDGSGGGEESGPTLADADTCDPADEEALAEAGIDFSRSGDTLTVRVPEMNSVEAMVGAIRTIGCVVKELDGPGSLGERVARTSGIDGNQTEEWGNFEANWSYDATSGLVFAVDEK